jgi:5-methylthioribose kinase
MHYDNRFTAGYMEQEANLQVARLETLVEKLEKERDELKTELEKLKKYVEFIEKLP